MKEIMKRWSKMEGMAIRRMWKSKTGRSRKRNREGRHKLEKGEK